MLILYLSILCSIEFGINTGGVYPVEYIQDFLNQGNFTTFFEHSTSGMINLYDGMYLWSVSDKRLDAITSLMNRGEPVKVYLEASYTPRWMSGWFSLDEPPIECLDNSPERDDWYSDLVSATVSRYRTGGVYALSNGIAGIGLWNEPDACGVLLPNVTISLDSRPAMVRYGEIASIAADAIHDIDPNIEIISGGFASPSAVIDLPHGWEGAVWWKMQPVFTGVSTNEWPPPPFTTHPMNWDVMPTALHWHPYRTHTENEVIDEEEWYDPLVIDSVDLMFRNRPGDLPLFLNEILPRFAFPHSPFDWTQIKQYAMEYCPIYVLSEWNGGIPPWREFYTEWRANYFITANLMLLETNDIDLLAPYPASADKWWIPAETGGWHNMEYTPEDLEQYADYAYIHMSNQLSGKYCLDVNETIEVPSGRVCVWEFADESSLPVDMIALRTRRDDPGTVFNYDEMHTVQITVPAGVIRVEHTGIRGDELSDVVINNGTIDVDINGYVSYIELYYLNPDQALPTVSSEVEWVVSSNSITATTLSNSARDRLYIFDLSGRIIESIEGVSTGLFREFYWNWSNSQKPNGIYFASFSRVGEIIDTRKVVVLK